MRIDERRVSRYRRVAVINDVSANLNRRLICHNVMPRIVRDGRPCVTPYINRLSLLSRPCSGSSPLIDWRVGSANLIEAQSCPDLIQAFVAVLVSVFVPRITTAGPSEIVVVILVDASEIVGAYEILVAGCPANSLCRVAPNHASSAAKLYRLVHYD